MDKNAFQLRFQQVIAQLDEIRLQRIACGELERTARERQLLQELDAMEHEVGRCCDGRLCRG